MVRERRWRSALVLAILFLVLLDLPLASGRRHKDRHAGGARRGVDHGHVEVHTEAYNYKRERARGPDTVEVAGSRLPDCSHACGSCTPCRRVMVSFVCAEEAETCPMAYKCMCKSKSFPVP
ncbi:hypothetical protein AMTRI_Chr02g262090 [Amborella trichopoda]|uniref:Epidermal patterning factor-like protein n=1 Tax=Amborella trichopoda TaxID=13333 RepID=W1P8P1_AMBTC|nr:protein EPIDERMAL PATTERNING FACTOR 1 [Amborella trichopoda]ERN03355.1 hypothetical protein AMTR_s00003p00245690 [Amborella trichopoda]|eukprot:XP_006841680.1 protein EPIDERMAL PATTERNING FACTOR 1 [Amborella trichopoda]